VCDVGGRASIWVRGCADGSGGGGSWEIEEVNMGVDEGGEY